MADEIVIKQQTKDLTPEDWPDGAESIFQTWSWCHSWLSIFKPASQLLVISLRQQEKIVALAPLYLKKTFFGLPLLRVSFIGTGPADYGGFILNNVTENGCDKETTSWSWLIEALQKTKWDCLDLHQLSKSTIENFVKDLPDNLSWTILKQEPCLVLPLPPTYEEFLSSLSKKFKNNLLYAQRRLQKEHKVQIISVTELDTLNETLTNFFNLHQKRWLKRKLPGLFLSSKNRHFHLKLAAELLKQNRLILTTLIVDKQPIAAFYGFKFKQTVYYYLGGFDPDWGKYSPLSLLILDVIAKSIAEGYKLFDFLRGVEPYKTRWGAKPQPLYRLIVYRRSLKGQLAMAVAIAENKVVQYVRQRLHS